MNKISTILSMLVICFTLSSFGPGEGYGIGDQVKDFSLKSVSGENVSLSDYEDIKGYIVVFTCNTCPYAVAYEDRLIELHNQMAPLGYPVVAINPNDPEIKPGDSYEEMIVRAKEKSFPFEYLFDESQEVFQQFGATKTPHTYVVDKSFKVRYIGAIDDNAQEAELVKENYVINAIGAIENNEEPHPTTTKAIGCSIKYNKG